MKQLLQTFQFSAAEINDFMAHSTSILCPKKTILLREGDISRTFYYAQKGIFRGGFTHKNDSQLTRVFFSPDTCPFVLSYASFIFQIPSLSFLEALEDGEVLAWDHDYMKYLERTDIRWTLLFKAQIDAVFSQRTTKEWQVYTMSAEERYLIFVEEFPQIVNQIPLHYIASYIGITAEALSRIRKRISSKK
jgi:CRP-like cAMP-binding protein